MTLLEFVLGSLFIYGVIHVHRKYGFKTLFLYVILPIILIGCYYAYSIATGT